MKALQLPILSVTASQPSLVPPVESEKPRPSIPRPGLLHTREPSDKRLHGHCVQKKEARSVGAVTVFIEGHGSLTVINVAVLLTLRVHEAYWTLAIGKLKPSPVRHGRCLRKQ
jgi:hypothetical protein